jgi:predicted DNA-binding transcriptional regulator YafY
MLDRVYGIALKSDPPEKVVLKCSPSQAKYFETLPLHPSQVIVEQGNERLIEVMLAPNPDLEQYILSLSPMVEVVAPESLRGRVAEKVRETAAKYGV